MKTPVIIRIAYPVNTIGNATGSFSKACSLIIIFIPPRSLYEKLILPLIVYANLTTQPCQNQQTSKSTTHQPMLSKSTTRQTLTSKSLCHVEIHAFGLIPAKRNFHDFITSDFFSQISKSPVLLDFFHTHFSTFDIQTTVSTWLERTE